MKIDNKLMEVVTKLNSLENINNMFIPIPDGFEIIQNTKIGSNVIFIAKKNNTMEQFLTDGALNTSETIEEHIKKVIDEIKKECENNPIYIGKPDIIKPYRNYANELFEFKIYAQDILVNENSFIRQLNAYFLETESREFCQLSVSAGQYKISEENKLLTEIQDLTNDNIILGLDDILIQILKRINKK